MNRACVLQAEGWDPVTPQLQVQVPDSTLSQECVPELQPVQGDTGSPPLAPDPPRASQCVHDCPAVPWADRGPFQHRVTKPLGMQLHPVLSTSHSQSAGTWTPSALSGAPCEHQAHIEQGQG